MTSHRLPTVSIPQLRAVTPTELQTAIRTIRTQPLPLEQHGVYASPTRAFRHARLWHWLGTHLPSVQQTENLHILNVGTGITKAYPTDSHYLPEVVELGALFAWRTGSVTSVDPNRDIEWIARAMQQGSTIAIQNIRTRVPHEAKQLRGTFGAHEDDVAQYVKAAEWIARQIRSQPTPDGTVLLFNQFSRTSPLVHHRSTMLGTSLMAQAFDISLALYVLPYMQHIAHPAIQAATFATLTHSTRMGGLIAITNLSPLTHAALLHYGCSPVHQIHFRRADQRDATENLQLIPPEYQCAQFTIDIFERRDLPQTRWAHEHLAAIAELNSTAPTHP